MKKVFAILLVSVFAFAMVACGDDDDGGSALDNVAACQEAEDALNELTCLTVDFNFSCDSYDGTTCDYAEYFNCLADLYTCEGDPEVLTYDADQLQECADLSEEIAGSC
jgi:hypothetical protein